MRFPIAHRSIGFGVFGGAAKPYERKDHWGVVARKFISSISSRLCPSYQVPEFAAPCPYHATLSVQVRFMVAEAEGVGCTSGAANGVPTLRLRGGGGRGREEGVEAEAFDDA